MPREAIIHNSDDDDSQDQPGGNGNTDAKSALQRNEEDSALRPKRMDEMIGQRDVFERIKITVDAALNKYLECH